MSQEKHATNAGPQDTGARFLDTGWTTVLAGRAGAEEALARLAKIYWYPLYASLRRKGRSPEDAKDLTQGFFAHLIRSNALEAVDPAKGKFRTFLLVSLDNFANSEWRKGKAQQRGGNREILSIDTVQAEESLASELAVSTGDSLTAYDRRWAVALVGEVMQKVRLRYSRKGKLPIYEALEPYLTGDVPDGTPARLAQTLGLNENTVKIELHRLRRDEFATVLEREVRETLHQPTAAELRDEIRYLFASLSA